MLSRTGTGAPQSGRMSPPSQNDTALPDEAGTYLKAGNLHENDDCRFQVSEPRSVITVQASNLLAQEDPAIPDSQGNTPLCLAVQTGNLAQAQQLILRGADVHHINLDGDNALTLAASGGHLSFIEWLDSHCPQPVNHENYYGDTALTLAARHGHQPLVQWLVSRDASLAHLNDQLKDALAEAVANGHLALAQWLASQGGDLGRVYPDGNNLYLHAVNAGHRGVAQWLEDSGVDCQQVNEFGDSALTLAARHGHHQLLAGLLEKNAAGIRQIGRDGDSLLLLAARRGHGETVKLLVQHGADIGLVNYVGSSALTLAATSSESLALWLCSAGADIHQIELSGHNAFTLAAQSGFFQLLQTLERLGINIHQINRNNDNAFTLVARQGSLPWCRWLADKGVNIHQVNCCHHNAVTLAALAGSQPLLQWLCAEHVDYEQIPETLVYDCTVPQVSWLKYGFNAAILAAGAGHFTEAQWLMRRGLSINQRDNLGRNAVIQAVALGQLEAVQWFIARGIKPYSFPDVFPERLKNKGHSAMSLAACLGHLAIMQRLHQHGGSLDEQDDGKILLILAADRGDLAMTQWLCQQGADLACKDDVGLNALGAAVGGGHLRLSQWLVGQGAKCAPDIAGHNDLVLAAQGGHNAIVRWLCRAKYPDDRKACDLLLLALLEGHRSLAVWLCLNVCSSFSGVDQHNYNALMLAAERGFLWLTQWLSERTSDINQVSRSGCTALMLAASNGHLPVVQWLCLEKNANLHRKNCFGKDALHMAIFNGEAETANWLIDQGMVLNPDDFKLYPLPWCSDTSRVTLLQCLLRQQFPPGFFNTFLIEACGEGDVLLLTCCFSAGIVPTDEAYGKCFVAAAAGGSLTTLEYLCRSLDRHHVDNAKKFSLPAAARSGNLHIIQWLWPRTRMSIEEQHNCLFSASASGQLHVIKWLHGQGTNIGAKTDWGYCSLSAAVRNGNTPVLEWLCQQGEDIYQVKVYGEDALLLAIKACEPQVAIWLFHRGFRLTKRDIDNVFLPHMLPLRLPVVSVILKMTPKIRRANLFRCASLSQKLWVLDLLQLDSGNKVLSEKEVDASFARFNQYNDQTLEHHCLVALAKVIGQQADTLEAGLKAVDSLPISFNCKCDLRELVAINLE